MGTNIPIVVISSIVGFLSAVDLFDSQNIMLGILSILVSLIKSLDNYFDYTKQCEGYLTTYM